MFGHHGIDGIVQALKALKRYGHSVPAGAENSEGEQPEAMRTSISTWLSISLSVCHTLQCPAPKRARLEIPPAAPSSPAKEDAVAPADRPSTAQATLSEALAKPDNPGPSAAPTMATLKPKSLVSFTNFVV